jgi:predicted metal-dependent phosphoesterase TrpH
LSLPAGEIPAGPRAFVDLHCHTSASFDSLASPRAVVRAAAARGLTHLAITDHDRIDGALAARAAAPAGLMVIVGEEVRTADGDLICLFLEHPIPPGRSATETIEAARRQGGLVGIPHPFDRLRRSLLANDGLLDAAEGADWVEAHNGRLVGGGNHRAAQWALEREMPGVVVSDAHSIMEVAVAYTAMTGDPSTPEGLRAALAGPLDLIPGRASYVVRAVTPFAKLIQRARGNGRVPPETGQVEAGPRPVR